ncbi:MAG: plasmid-partitioning protein ParB [Herminiimonas sp.]|nr:plasmid-partitioning protein ParB [Herminiimonas sp.]
MNATKTAAKKKPIPTTITIPPRKLLKDLAITDNGDLLPNTKGPALRFIALDAITCLPQVRTVFKIDTLQQLADDIKARGMLQPVLLRPSSEDGKYLVIAGERRVRAAWMIGLRAVPAIVGDATAEQADEMQLAEYIQREELSLADTARAVRQLFDREGKLDKVAAIVHKSKSWVCKHLAVTQPDFGWRAKRLLENGTTEDLELLTLVSSIEKLDWKAATDIEEGILAGTCDRAKARTILQNVKATIAQAKQEEADAKARAKGAAPATVVMPGMNGVTLGQEARKLIPGIKVVLASGYAAPALADEDSSIRDFHFINKPYRMAETVKKLRTAG